MVGGQESTGLAAWLLCSRSTYLSISDLTASGVVTTTARCARAVSSLRYSFWMAGRELLSSEERSNSSV